MKNIYYITSHPQKRGNRPAFANPFTKGVNIMKSFFKSILVLTFVTAFLLTGCDTTDVSSEISSDVGDLTSSVSEDSSKEAFTTDDIAPIFKTDYSKKQIEVSKGDLDYLEIQAPILTEHLILSLQNLDINFDKEEINQFFSLLTKYQDNPDYRYTPIMRESQDRQYYLFCFEDVNRTAYEIFGEREWNFETLNIKVDEQHRVYAEEFGYGLYIPYFGTDFETTVTDPTVEVEFTLYRHGSKDGDPYEFDEGRYIARYSVIKDEAGAFLRFKEIEKKHPVPEEYKLDEKKGEITNCNAEEASEYLKTDEAIALATHFGRNISIKEFSNTSEIVDSVIFFRFMQGILLEIGTVDDNADIVVVERSVADGYLEKYFGIKKYDPKESSYYDRYSGKYHFPWATEKSMWIVQDIELESIEQNECTFRYVYSYVADEPPYYSARITFRVMKDENGAFLQAVSCTDTVSEFATIQEAIDALY